MLPGMSFCSSFVQLGSRDQNPEESHSHTERAELVQQAYLNLQDKINKDKKET
jgi:hypothetical protein